MTAAANLRRKTIRIRDNEARQVAAYAATQSPTRPRSTQSAPDSRKPRQRSGVRLKQLSRLEYWAKAAVSTRGLSGHVQVIAADLRSS